MTERKRGGQLGNRNRQTGQPGRLIVPVSLDFRKQEYLKNLLVAEGVTNPTEQDVKRKFQQLISRIFSETPHAGVSAERQEEGSKMSEINMSSRDAQRRKNDFKFFLMGILVANSTAGLSANLCGDLYRQLKAGGSVPPKPVLGQEPADNAPKALREQYDFQYLLAAAYNQFDEL